MSTKVLTATIFHYYIQDWQGEPHYQASFTTPGELHERILADWQKVFSDWGEEYEGEDYAEIEIITQDGDTVIIGIEKENL